MNKLRVKKIAHKQKEEYNQTISHPLQSYEWGEFRKKTGVKVVRREVFGNGKLTDGFQLTIHKLPHLPWTIGYLPKGNLPTQEILKELIEIGESHNTVFIKLEPNVKKESGSLKQEAGVDLKGSMLELVKSDHPLFTKYTFQIDLTKSKEELLKQMKSKTRYNVRLAKRKGVKVVEDNSEDAFVEYLKLMQKTTQRQNFYAHDEEYHRKMWETLHPAGIAHLLKGIYKGKTLVSWILFLFNDVLYYPYGASSSKHREVMASNRVMWDAMLWGKKKGAKVFDLWGSLGPEPDKSDPWYGFHRFKDGYGGRLIEFIGSYDLVLKPGLYRLYNAAHKLRWSFLHRI